jgi:hypothetical protein
VLAAVPYMLSSLCSMSSMESSGPIRITTAPASLRNDLRMAVCMVSLYMIYSGTD